MGKDGMKRVLRAMFSAWLAVMGWALPALGAAAVPGVIDAVGGTTLTPVAGIPAAPSDLLANAFPGVLPVGLIWKDNSANETGFTIERSTDGGAFVKIATVAAGVTKYLDSSVTNDMLCRYRVCANSTPVNSAYSNEYEWLTRPYNPKDLVAEPNTLGPGIDLRWNPNNHNATYQIQKTFQISSQQKEIQLINVGADKYSYLDTDVVPGKTYSYFVMACSNTDRTDGSNTVTINYMGPPTEVKVAHFPNSPKLTLMWKDNTDNETKFVVEMAHSQQGPVFTHEVPANTTEFVDDVVIDELYMYRVKAVGPDGSYSPYSDLCHWYSEPRIPENLTAEAVSYSEVALSWLDTSKYEAGFKIWRKGGGTTDWIEPGANTTSCSDKGLKPNTTYTYSIYAYNVSSEISDLSPEVSVTTPTVSFITPGDLIQKKGGLIPTGTKLDTVLQIGSPSMTVNGETREIDPGKSTAPVIVGGRTLLPIRAVIEAYGGTVEWDGAARKVTVVCNGKTIELWIDSLNTKVNGESKTTEVAPQIINDRTMLPLRFISENLGLSVDWDGASQRVTIKTGG
ncbi:MAG: hypothetical protein HPY50_16575 [Firmicutes bacterium]|nr:hypothetical protein [Bacillota bacterium]